MKNLITTLKNIWKIEELRTRILVTLGFILIYRLGAQVPLPGIDASVLAAANQASGGPDGLLGLLNLFTGGAFAQASIFALGIMPYISASIVIQLMGIAVPYFQKLQREGESGRRKINNITRYLTILITGSERTERATCTGRRNDEGGSRTRRARSILGGDGRRWCERKWAAMVFLVMGKRRRTR